MRNKAASALLFVLFLSSALMAQSNCGKFEKIIGENHFYLVVDKSGSMYGQPMADAKTALRSFVQNMKNNDYAALIEFSDGIAYSQRLTNNKQLLNRAIDAMNANGGTRLYDAIGKALQEIKYTNSSAMLLFMTDGWDNGSSLRPTELSNMLPSQGVYVYGIGLGNVDQAALNTIANATGGKFEYTSVSGELTSIYDRAQKYYHQNIAGNKVTRSQLVVRSLPAGQPVTLSGRRMGNTPLLISNLQAGDYKLEVNFGAGTWACDLKIAAGMKGYVDARESDVSRNLAIMSIPHNSMAFLDGQFVGYTQSFGPKKNKTQKGLIFKKEIVNYDFSRQLIVEQVAPGKHTLRIVALPDDELDGFFQPVEHSFIMPKMNTIIDVDCRTGEVEMTTTDKALEPGGAPPKNPFDELDDLDKEFEEGF
jgi:hypothetical protein